LPQVNLWEFNMAMSTDYVNALGAGSGLDTVALVTAMVNADKSSKQSSIDRRSTENDANISGLAQVNSALNTLKTAFSALDDKSDFNFSTLTNSTPTVVNAKLDSSTAVPGTYKVTVSQLAQNDVFQTTVVSDVLEVDTYTLSADVASSGSVSFTYDDITYTQAFDTDAATTMGGLVAAINAGSAASSVTAAVSSSTVFTITKDVGSDTQMTKGTIGGTTNGSTALSISTADTTTGLTAQTLDQNGSSAATVVIQVGSGPAETVTLAAGSTSLPDLVEGINALTADVSARLVKTSTGNYRVVVEGPQGSENALTITDSVFGLQNTSVPEIDTYTLAAGVSSGGSASFTYGGTTYTQGFDTSASNTIVLLAAQVNAASGISVAAVSNSDVAFTITNDVGSDTQMTKGTIGGTTNGSLALSISTADTTVGTAINKIQTAQNSTISINGLSVSSASNQIEAVAPGLTIDLMETTSSPVVLSVGRDTTSTKASIISVVESYNAFEAVMKDLTTVKNAAGERGVLNKDSGITQIRTAMYKLMTDVSSTPGTTITSMADMGISRTQAGVMIIDSAALGSAVTNNYDEITKLFSADTNNQFAIGDASRGLAGDIVKQVSDYLASTGILASRGTSYSAITASVLKEQTNLDLKMEAAEARYTKQFSTMNKIMEEMNSMQDYLSSQLENLPFTAKND
jgi:flagellar hook-associated protein 2